MNKLMLFATLASLAATPAFAGNDKDGNTYNSSGNGGAATASPTVNNNPTFNNDPRATASVVAPNTNTNTALGGTAAQQQGQGQLQGQLQGQGQQQGQGQVASSNQGQSQGLSNTNSLTQGNQQTASSTVGPQTIAPNQSVAFNSPKQFRGTPDVGAGYIVNVASCAMGDSASISLPGFGAQVNKSRESSSCDVRADAAMWLALGEKEAAVNRMYGLDNKASLDAARGR